MKKKHLLITALAIVAALALTTTAFALHEETADGTITSIEEVDGETVVTFTYLDTDGETVLTDTFTFEEGDYDHPIVALLAEYFGEDVEALEADWADALDTLDTEDGTIASIEEVIDEDTGEVTGWIVTLVDEDGEEVGTVELDAADEDDVALAESISDALDTLNVTLEQDVDSGDWLYPDVGETIEDLHEGDPEVDDDGYGFGDLVKIYAIAEEQAALCEAGEPVADDEIDPCDVTVEYLLELYDTEGMGFLFDTFGKPALLGVGQVRKAVVAAALDGSSAAKEACKNGGWAGLGYSNQGQCVSYYASGGG